MERTCLTAANGGADLLISQLLIIVFTTFFISGCSRSEQNLPYPLIITEEGLGAIHPYTPFDQISTSLSGFTFEKLSLVSPNQNTQLLQMQRGTTLIAHIVSDPSGKKIASIDILSPLVKNRHNQGLGDPLPDSKAIICQHLFCHYLQEPSLIYTISSERVIRKITYQKL